MGSQYRSAILTTSDQHLKVVKASLNSYQKRIEPKLITTEVKECESFYYAEDYHQQYLHDNPNGYCMHWNLGVNFELSDLD